MKRQWLLIDANNICHRHHYATAGKDFGGAAGMYYGVVRELRALSERFPAAIPVFCFDLGEPKRKAFCPGYKEGRKRGIDPEKQQEKYEIARLIEALREKHLPRLTPNVFAEYGFEADDLIANIALQIPSAEQVIIVSSDKDLWQLLNEQAAIVWNSKTKTPLTEQLFRQEWGLTPGRWPTIKAIAGCSSDNIKGVEGVGEFLAARYLRNEMKETTTTWQKIEAFKKSGGMIRNLKLVQLPFAGCPDFHLKIKRLTERDWERWSKELCLPSGKSVQK